MLERILGKNLAFYVRAHRTLLITSLLLTAVSALLVVVPAYLLQPFIDEGMKSGSDPATWKIPWVAFSWEDGLSWERSQKVLVEGISPNRLLVLSFPFPSASTTSKDQASLSPARPLISR